MARPAKSLAAHVRDGTFRADRHADLLLGPLVDDERLRGLQEAYRAAADTAERLAVARAFAKAARERLSSGGQLGGQTARRGRPIGLRSFDRRPIRSRGLESRVIAAEHVQEGLVAAQGGAAPGSPETDDRGRAQAGDDVAEFFSRSFKHTKGPLAGQPFVLEPFQADFVREFYRRDEEGRRIYRLGVLGLPRGNGKSPLAAGLGLYELTTRLDSPDVFVAAGGRDQARVAFNFARQFVEGGDLIERVHVGRNELVYPDRLGSMRVLSAEGALQHGLSVSAAIVDELWAFATEKQRELFTALETALHKRLDSFLLAITTAGFDRTSLLGKLYDGALAQLTLERPNECLTVGRDEENGVLLWWHGAPDGADVDDESVWRQANPASWVDLRDLRRQRNSPSTSESTFRRLHLNQWTTGEDVWISPDAWQACRSEEEIPERAEVFVGVDASFSGDATAVAWAHRTAAGPVLVRCHVWSALTETPAHVHVPGGRIDLTAVEDFIIALAKRFAVREVVYDPAFFARSAEHLDRAGVTVASLDQRSTPMREGYSQFYEAVNSRSLAHDGDEVLAAHVVNAAAHVDPAGHWKVRKIKQSRKIDALVASVIAHSRAARAPLVSGYLMDLR